MSTDNDSGFTPRSNVYTNADIISYDRFFSTVTFKFGSGSGMATVTPINPEFIGKPPQKTAKIYNYDNKVTYGISVSEAIVLLEGIQYLMDEEAGVSQIHTSAETGANTKRITIFRPSSVRLAKNVHPDYIIRFERSSKDDVVERSYHIFSHSTLHLKTADDEISERIETGLLTFIQFLKEIVKNAIGTAHHGSRRAAAQSGNNNNKTRSSTPAIEEESFDGTSEESTATTGVTSAALEAEFED